MDIEFIIPRRESQIDPDIVYNNFKIPADLKKAELHGLAYRIYKEPKPNSIKCNCCGFYKDHIKYKLDDDLNDDCLVASLYFQSIKWMFKQLTILCFFFVFFGLIFNSQGDECEKLPNCDQNSLKIYSIWNLVPNFFSLTDIKYLIVILLGSFFFIICIKCGSYKETMDKMVIYFILIKMWMNGFYFPDRITNEEILGFLNRNSEVCKQIYSQNKKLYLDLLFEKLKLPYFLQIMIQTKKNKQKMILLNFVRSKTKNIQVQKQLILKNTYCKQFLPFYQFNSRLHSNLLFQRKGMIQIILIKMKKIKYINITNYYGLLQQHTQYLLHSINCLTLQQTNVSIDLHTFGIKLVIYYQRFKYIVLIQQLKFHTLNSITIMKKCCKMELAQYSLKFSIQNFFFFLNWREIKSQISKIKPDNTQTQIEANQLFQQIEFIFYKYEIEVSKIFARSMMFGFVYPLIIPLSMLQLFIFYCVDKYLFINYARPIQMNIEEVLLQGFFFLLNMSMLQGFFWSCFMFFEWWIFIIVFILFFPFFIKALISHYNKNIQVMTKEIFNVLVEKQYEISNDDKYQIFLSLQNRLKKYVEEIQKKRNRVDEGYLLD